MTPVVGILNNLLSEPEFYHAILKNGGFDIETLRELVDFDWHFADTASLEKSKESLVVFAEVIFLPPLLPLTRRKS